MPRLENDVKREILQLCQRPGIRLWRANAGMVKTESGGMYYGAPTGTADIIGWRTDHIDGVPFARFVAIEVKRRPGMKPTEAQAQFIADVLNSGGIAGVAGSVDEAMQILGIL